MGVDVTLFILESYSSGTGFVTAAFKLSRNRDFWPQLEALHLTRRWGQIQLPHGAWSNFSGARPAEYDDREGGHLQVDAYGKDLWSAPGASFGTCTPELDKNRKILAFIADVYPQHDVVVFWC